MKLPKIFVLLVTYYLLLVTCASPVLAVEEQSAGIGGFQQQLQNCADTGSTSLECWVAGSDQISEDGTTGVLPSVANGLTTMIVGKTLTQEELQQFIQEPTSYKPGGAIGGVNYLISAMYINKPASSKEYFADLGKNLGIVKPAYAQTGIGFEGLKPMLPLWKVFRNIAYLFFTIIFVVMGFAIMFRAKIDPQTVISIQNALPRIIVALILVTFSYAIAGLLIDLVYILISLGVLIISPAVGWTDIAFQQQKYMGLSFGEGVALLFGGGINFLGKILPLTLTVMGVIGIFVALITANPLGLLAAGLPLLILAILALYVIFKLFLSLLNCYISIILSVLFAPLQIMIGVLPGAQMGFGSWMRNLIANLLAFPAVAIFMLLGWAITAKGLGPTWTPPVVSISGGPLVALIGFGMLLIVHKIPDMVKETLGIKPSPFGGAIGESLAPLRAIVGVAWPGTRQAGAEKYLGWGIGVRKGWQVGARGTVGRAGELIGAWKAPNP